VSSPVISTSCSTREIGVGAVVRRQRVSLTQPSAALFTGSLPQALAMKRKIWV
jgi:hypothetical protein